MWDTSLPAGISFDSINVNGIDSASGIFVGLNTQCFWNSSKKINSGFGTVKGAFNVVMLSVNTVIDPDYIDNPVNVLKV